jgi:hypothetical protein
VPAGSVTGPIGQASDFSRVLPATINSYNDQFLYIQENSEIYIGDVIRLIPGSAPEAQPKTLSRPVETFFLSTLRAPDGKSSCDNQRMARLDNTLLEAALLGYQAEQKRIQAAIADLQKRIGGKSATPSPPKSTPATRKKHRISAEGRARIAAAQRKRWAAAKKEDSAK